MRLATSPGAPPSWSTGRACCAGGRWAIVRWYATAQKFCASSIYWPVCAQHKAERLLFGGHTKQNKEWCCWVGDGESLLSSGQQRPDLASTCIYLQRKIEILDESAR